VLTDLAVHPAALAAVRDVRLALGLLAAPGPPLDPFYDTSLVAAAAAEAAEAADTPPLRPESAPPRP
jgi:hypothetical protein